MIIPLRIKATYQPKTMSTTETLGPTAPAPAEAAYLNDEHREAVAQAVADALGRSYECLRVWEAWGVGTMGPDDFALIAEDSDRVAEIADAAVKAFFDAATRAFIPPYPAHFLRPSMDDVMDLAKAFKLEVNDPYALMWLVVTALSSWGDIRPKSND